MTLSDQQLAFVAHDPSRCARVVAGPGTGKSFTSVSYLERLAGEHPEKKVRMLTFTRAATAEFAAKLGDANLEGLGIVPPGTVHSFALSLMLRMKGVSIPMPLRIPDTWETKVLIRPHLSRRMKALGHGKATPTVVETLEREMAAGWQSLDPERELYVAVNPALGNAYVGMWGQHRWVFGYVLLAELTFRAGNALEDHGTEVVDLDLVLVDEYQDLNEADIKMVRLVKEGGTSVLAIGDDDQSIYGWRLAAPAGIRRFLSDFGTTCDYPLTESRRCGSKIIEAAGALIESAPDRPAKARLRSLLGAPEGVYEYLRFESEGDEVVGVACIIAKRIADGIDPRDIVVLVRSNEKTWASLLRPHLDARRAHLASTDWVEEALSENEVRRGIALAHLAP